MPGVGRCICRVTAAAGSLWIVLSIVAGMSEASDIVGTADTVYVNPEPAWGTAISLAFDHRIDVATVPGEAPISVDLVAPEPSGRVYVYDASGSTIMEFDPGGRYVRTIDPRDSGGAEHSRVAGMAVLASGNLAVSDPNSHRLSFFDSAGTCVRTVECDFSGFYGPDPFKVDRENNCYVETSGESQGAPPGSSMPLMFIEVDAAGAVADTIHMPPLVSGGRFVRIVTEGARDNFVDRVCGTLDADGRLVWGHNRRYALTVAGKGMHRILVFPATKPIPLAGAEREQWTRWAARYSPDWAAALPATKPVFRSIRSDREGRLWVERYAAAVPVKLSENQTIWVDPQVFDVVTVSGDYLGTIQLPLGSRLAAIDGMRVWIVEAGDGGSSLAACYTIHPSSH